MKNLLTGALAVLFIVGIAVTQDKPAKEETETAYKFVGASRCKMCHKGEKNGNIYEIWEASPHAKAFETLGSDKAKETYASLGKEGNPQEDPACLKCHVTGYGMDASLTEKVKMEKGISCEACHGPGGDYWKKNIMEDRALSIQNGMVAEPKEGCVSCHNEDNPNHKEFEYEEYYSKIEHHTPKSE